MTIEMTTPAVAPVVPAAPALLPVGETVDAYDAMSSVFDELLEPATTPVEPVATSEVDAAAAAAVAAPKEGTPTDEAAAATVTTPAEPVEPVAESAATEVDWEARFKELDAKTKAAPEPEAKPPVETAPPDKAPPLYTTDEAAVLAAYEESWSEISRGETLKRRSEYQQLVNHIFSEVARVYGPLVEQGARAAETVAETTTLAAIRSVHTDYDDPMYDAVVAWADGLAGYRKKFAQQVINEGEPQDVVDLITEFKSATGRSKPKVVAGGAAPAPVTPATPAVTELSATAKKAAKALGVVESKRSAAIPGTDPDDFDSAWEEAVGK